MTLSPAARRTIDRGALVLTALAIVILLATLAERTAGSVAGPVWLTRVICLGFVLARLLPWLTRQYTANRNAVASLAALAVFVGTLYALALPAVTGVALLVGRAALLFGVPALVVWKLDPITVRQIWHDHRREFPPTPDQ